MITVSTIFMILFLVQNHAGIIRGELAKSKGYQEEQEDGISNPIEIKDREVRDVQRSYMTNQQIQNKFTRHHNRIYTLEQKMASLEALVAIHTGHIESCKWCIRYLSHLSSL